MKLFRFSLGMLLAPITYAAHADPMNTAPSVFPDLAKAFSQKLDALNGQAQALQLTGGFLDGTQRVGSIGTRQPPRTLAQHLTEQVNVLDYGAIGNGTTDSGPSIMAALAASATNGASIIFPRTNQSYLLSTGTFTPETLGRYALNGNRFLGAAAGDPSTGHGLFTAPYTNPWNVTTDLKWEFDPAAQPAGPNVTNEGLTIECAPNHPNAANSDSHRNWIACVYRGVDTGTGGAPGTSISTEVDNDVINLNENSGVGYELDMNFNGQVKDRKWSTGLLLTGGGASGNTTNSVALNIMHVAYDGSWLPWTTGLSIREATNMISLYNMSPNEAGFYLQGFAADGSENFHIDKNGFASVQGLNSTWAVKGQNFTATDHTTPAPTTTCEAGALHADDNYLYVCVSSKTYKRVALSNLQ